MDTRSAMRILFSTLAFLSMTLKAAEDQGQAARSLASQASAVVGGTSPAATLGIVTEANPGPWVATTGMPAGAAMESIPGTFLLQSFRQTLLTANLHSGAPVMRTDSATPGDYEQFTLWYAASAGPYFAIQSRDWKFLTAPNGGGLTANAIQDTSSQIVDDSLFRLSGQQSAGASIRPVALSTVRGYYVTAVGGGGKSSGETLHTDATMAKSWEQFTLYRCGTLGNLSEYEIVAGPDGDSGIGDFSVTNVRLAARDGGGQTQNAVVTDDSSIRDRVFTLVRQPWDGTYGIQTANGNYLTAVGLYGLHSDATGVQLWEKFTFPNMVSNSCQSVIRAYDGSYLRSDPVNHTVTLVGDVAKATKWRFIVYFLRQ